MLKKYLTKFTVDILPSVAATVIGAYIVNHYIVTKPAADAPVAAAMSAAKPKTGPAPAKADVSSADVGNIPEAGVKAKGISEKAMLEKSAAEKTPEKPQDKSSEKSAEKPADKPAETASIPADTRRHQPAPREKTAKAVPAPVPPAAPTAVPVVAAAPNPAASTEAASAPEDRRDANDLARAAIERLRGANEGSPRPQEAARIPEAPRVASAPAIRPLPPPIMVSTPERETFDSSPGSFDTRPPYAAGSRNDDPRRLTPPADIPTPPLDLRAEAAVPSERGHTNVAEDVLSAAKSVFHAVLPK
jgi:hypothetical protein